MASTTTRRPLQALLSLLALLLLTGIVWWRVASRDDSDSSAASDCPSPSASSSQSALPARATVTVQVLNSTSKTGLAGKVRTQLQQYGFGVTEAGNDPIKKPPNTGVAQIRYGPSAAEGAKLVQYYFPGATMQATTSKAATVTVAVGAKYSAVATAPQVAAALKSDKLTVATAAPPPPVPGSC